MPVIEVPSVDAVPLIVPPPALFNGVTESTVFCPETVPVTFAVPPHPVAVKLTMPVTTLPDSVRKPANAA